MACRGGNAVLQKEAAGGGVAGLGSCLRLGFGVRLGYNAHNLAGNGEMSAGDVESTVRPKWQSALLWVGSFLFGLLVIRIWDVRTLLLFFLVLSFAAFAVRSLGLSRFVGVERYSLKLFWGRIRIMLILGFLPPAYAVIKNLSEDFSVRRLVQFVLICLILGLIWNVFDWLPRRWA